MKTDEGDTIVTNLDFLIGFSNFKSDFNKVFKTISYLKKQMLALNTLIFSNRQNILEKIIHQEVLNFINLNLKTMVNNIIETKRQFFNEQTSPTLDYRSTLKGAKRLQIQ